MHSRDTLVELPATAPAARPDADCERIRGGQHSVLFVVNASWFFLSHRLPLALAAREAGYEVHLLTTVTSAADLQALEGAGIIVHRAPITRARLNPFADLRFFLCLLQTMRSVSPCVVHNVTVKPVIYSTLAARMSGVPAIINAISGMGYAFTDRSRWLLASLVRSAYRFVLRSPRVHLIVQNDDDAREFTAARLVRPQQTVLIRGSGVDLASFRPVPEDAAAPPLVVLPARMLRDKGVIEFVSAARQISARGVPARFALAGPLDTSNPAGLSRNELDALTANSPVEWLGRVQDMPALYRRAHIVCLPSHREGLPKSLIEACASGRPVVTTDAPGCRSVVMHGVNGLLVPVRDANALADALQQLIEDGALRARLGAAGRSRAEQDFGIGSVIEQTLGLYVRALAGG
jgi:glycosyltransferase involved in cell wall biosynthesis